MGKRIEKVKIHLKENKKTYLACGGTALVTVVGTLVFAKKAPLEVSPKIQQILSYRPHATIEVFIEALGDPGNVIQDITTGTIYASQGQAARELGITPARISEQLKGARDHINGHVFTKLGKAHVTAAVA